MTDKDLPRLYVTAGLFLLFGYVLYQNSDNQMLLGAIIGSFGTAVSFWLGSSKGSADKSTQIEKEMLAEDTGTQANPMIVAGKPGAEAVTTTPKPDGTELPVNEEAPGWTR